MYSLYMSGQVHGLDIFDVTIPRVCSFVNPKALQSKQVGIAG